MFHTCYRYVVFNSRGDNFMEARETVNCLEVYLQHQIKIYLLL